jgi:multidrug efflux pump
MAFFGGSTGVIYRQFSITMVSAMALSVLVALIFTPALCATLLKPPEKGRHKRRGFFGWFNRQFERGNRKYEGAVSRVVNRTGRYLIAFVVIVGLMALLFMRIPKSFLPDEDQGIMFAQVTTPAGATNERTSKVLAEVRDYFLKDEKQAVEGVFTIAGFNFAGHGQTSGLVFVRLKPGLIGPVRAIACRPLPPARHSASRRSPMLRHSHSHRRRSSSWATRPVSTLNCSTTPTRVTTS